MELILDNAAYERVRSAFEYFDPAAANPVFMENAGGSQVPRCVADAVRSHLLRDCAQLGAGHAVSARSEAAVAAARQAMAAFVGAPDEDGDGGGGGASSSIALGASCSQLLAALGACYARLLSPGDEVVVHDACHEANAGPWVRCAEESGATLRWWRVDTTPAFSPLLDADGGGTAAPLAVAFPCAARLADLERLLSPATRLVALAHVSNLLGGVTDLAAAVAAVRRLAPRARIVVDGVAFAPHRRVDVAALGVDWYCLSIYKTWGPHLAALYGSAAARRELMEGCRRRRRCAKASGAPPPPPPAWPAPNGPNHYFIGSGHGGGDDGHGDGDSAAGFAYWFELGGASHEACAGAAAVGDYLRRVAAAVQGGDSGSGSESGKQDGSGVTAAAAAAARPPPLRRAEVDAAFAAVEALEGPLAGPILALLAAHPAVILVGPGADAGAGSTDGADGGCWAGRVPTISFVHRAKPSAAVSAALQARGFAVRHGHMYAHRMMTALAPALAPYLERSGKGGGGDDGEQPPDGGDAALRAIVDDGVVRISLLHYNTPSEVDALVAALREVL